MKRGFYGVLVLLACLSPFFYADLFVMLPSAMVFLLGVGAMNYVARIEPTCLRCGAVVSAVGGSVDSAQRASARRVSARRPGRTPTP